MGKRILVSDIEWDTDGEQVDLPQSIEMIVNSENDFDSPLFSEEWENEICDRLSDEYGWCLNGFCVDKVLMESK